MKPIRRRAHVATLVTVCWTPLSALFGFLLFDAWRNGHRDYSGLCFTSTVLFIHAVFAAAAVHLWKTEKPQLTPEVSGFVVDDLLDIKPEDINLVEEKLRLKKTFIAGISVFVCIVFAAWQSYTTDGIHLSGFKGTVFLFGAIFFLHIIFETIRYLILKKCVCHHLQSTSK